MLASRTLALRLFAPLALIATCTDLVAADDWDGTASSVIRAGDIDRDGIDDVLVLGRGPFRGRLQALRMPAFEPLWSTNDNSDGFGASIQNIGDFNADGRDDFAVGSDAKGRASVTVVSSADGSVLTRKLNTRLAVRLTGDPVTWLVTPASWNRGTAAASLRIDPSTDRVLACFASPCDGTTVRGGLTAARAFDGKQEHVVIGFGNGASVFSLDGKLEHSFPQSKDWEGYAWSCTTPTPSPMDGPAHVIVSKHHRRCDVFDTRTMTVTRTVYGRNVVGCADAFASSVDAYYEPKATEPTVLVGAAEMWAEGFDDGYVTLSRPSVKDPLILLLNREFGFHACFIGDLDGDGAREVFAISVSPTLEDGRAKRTTIDAYVLDGKSGRELRRGVVNVSAQPVGKAR